MNNIETKLIARLGKLFSLESSGHDIGHLTRVHNIAVHLQAIEGGDEEVISLATLLHDMHRLMEYETGKFCTPADSLSRIREILADLEISEDLIEKIVHCVSFHEEYGFSEKGKTVDDIETLILQDADNLDAMGAIGIARAFSFAGSHNVAIWDPKVPIEPGHFDESRLDPSEIHHFYNKLLRLKENMNTKAGREMAQERHDFMELYLNHFFKEWQGEL